MSNGFLSQEEIDSLLNGGGDSKTEETPVVDETLNIDPFEKIEIDQSLLSDIEKDLLGEIGNISMGSASTALYQIINQKVDITTPTVSITSLNEIKQGFDFPNIILDVEYVSGIIGRNILIMKTTDAGVIANLMMGGDGNVEVSELSEIEVSAVQEAMNQMIGSAATSMATMFAREVNISPPLSKIWTNKAETISDVINEYENIVKISFNLKIGTLIDSDIMQILPVATAKKIVSIMMGEENAEATPTAQPQVEQSAKQEPVYQAPKQEFAQEVVEKPVEYAAPQPVREPVAVHKAGFTSLEQGPVGESHKNIDLILDVPLNVSVVLGRTKKSIKDILDLSTGSLIELDKLADEPVEVLINGKKIAYGEVVVVDENFGVRITDIVSGTERIKSLR